MRTREISLTRRLSALVSQIVRTEREWASLMAGPWGEANAAKFRSEWTSKVGIRPFSPHTMSDDCSLRLAVRQSYIHGQSWSFFALWECPFSC